MLARALVILACWSIAVPAGAQDANALVEEGLALRRAGRDADAAERFRAAYAIDRSARSLAQVALAEQAAGDWVRAEHDLVAAMALPDPWVAEHRSVLDEALATIRSHLGRLQVVSNVGGARVWIDGREVATLPMAEPISAVVGTVVVEVRADGYVTVQRSATVSAGELSRLSVDLVPGVAPADQPPLEQAPAIAPEHWPSPLLAVGAVMSGVAVLTLAGMIGAVVVREDHVRHWNDDSLCPPELPGGRLQTCADVWSALRTAEDWAIALGITTGVLAVAGAILIGIGAGEDASEPRAHFHVGPGLVGLDVEARF